MKRILMFSIALSCLVSCTCIEDFIYSFDKLREYSFLANRSGQDVTVNMQPAAWENEDHVFSVMAGDELEIPDTERWHLSVKASAGDSVVFTFADGSRIVHYYRIENRGSAEETVLYNPEENNIFRTDGKNPSWSRTRLRAQRYRNDYCILK